MASSLRKHDHSFPVFFIDTRGQLTVKKGLLSIELRPGYLLADREALDRQR